MIRLGGQVMNASAGVGSTARERLLTSAEQLFSERGYTAVTLRDIAEAVGVRQASLYHYFPGGKEQIFVTVTELGLERVRRELTSAANATLGQDLCVRLARCVHVLIGQPPIDLARMIRSDMPAIHPEHADRMTRQAFDALMVPLADVFRSARERGEQRMEDDLLLAGWLLGLIETIQIASQFSPRSSAMMANDLIDVLIDGVRTR